MSNEKLGNNSVDKGISTLGNNNKVRQHSLSSSHLERTKKIDEEFFKDIILKSIPNESQITNIRFEGPYVAL
ncbi:MAG: hypothetical protein ACRD93_03390, partial [Nitrososphaeraceae archaeon]